VSDVEIRIGEVESSRQLQEFEVVAIGGDVPGIYGSVGILMLISPAEPRGDGE
jgi:hypothetical protein